MTAVWITIAAVAAVNFALKAVGPVVAGGRELPAWAPRVIAMLAPAMLTALVVVGVISDGNRLVIDERLAGVAAGAVVLAARAPMAIAFVAAAATAALLRAA